MYLAGKKKPADFMLPTPRKKKKKQINNAYRSSFLEVHVIARKMLFVGVEMGKMEKKIHS